MTKIIDTSRLLTEGELNAVVGGMSQVMWAAVQGTHRGAIEAAAPGTWVPPGAPTGLSFPYSP